MWNSSDHKNTFSFDAFIMNNKVLLYLYLCYIQSHSNSAETAKTSLSAKHIFHKILQGKCQTVISCHDSVPGDYFHVLIVIPSLS